MKRTPIAQVHEEAGARMVDFSGWYLPVQYSGILAEHGAVRERCGIFDTCHMGRLVIQGEKAAAFISSTLTVDAQAMQDGQCRYGFMLNENAGIIDDLIVYRRAGDRFMVVVNSATHDKDISHLKSRLPAGITIEDIGPATAKIDVQGPSSPHIIGHALNKDLSELRYFRFTTLDHDGQPATVSRTGYTGETGFEIYLPAEKAASLWSDLIDAGALPCGLGARDTLRLEAGLPLYGHELTEEADPAAAGMMRYIDLSRDFLGADALRVKAGTVPSHKLTPFRIEGRQAARHGNRAVINGEEIGWVTSGSFAPTLGYSIGFAYIDPSRLGNTETFGIDNGRKILNASITESPFYRKKRKAEG